MSTRTAGATHSRYAGSRPAATPASSRRTAHDVPALGSAELRRLDVRVHGVLSVVMGAVAVCLAPLTEHVAVTAVVGVLAIIVGAVHLVLDAGRFPSRSLTIGHIIAVLSVMVGAGASGHSADLAAGPILCVIVTIHAACFRAARETWLLVGWCLACYSALLLATISSVRAVGAVCVLAATLVPIAFTLTWLRQRVDLLVRDLHHLADHDPLTGLLNREGLRRRAVDTAVSATSDHGMLALLLLDVDRFKVLNDELGHPAGDAALTWLAEHLRSCVRAPAVVARYGGEEFVVLLPIDSVPAARDRADELRLSVEAAGSTRSRPMTVSVGVAVGRPDDDFHELFQRADLALYAAKAMGRNRVEVSGLDTAADAQPSTGPDADGSPERLAGVQVA